MEKSSALPRARYVTSMIILIPYNVPRVASSFFNHDFLSQLIFSHTWGSQTLPTKSNTWGILDQYVPGSLNFKYSYKILKKKLIPVFRTYLHGILKNTKCLPVHFPRSQQSDQRRRNDRPTRRTLLAREREWTWGVDATVALENVMANIICFFKYPVNNFQRSASKLYLFENVMNIWNSIILGTGVY